MSKTETLTIRRIPFYLFLIFIGIAIAIVFFLWNKKDYVFPKLGGKRFDWIEIPDPAEAKTLMDAYVDEQKGIWIPSYRLRTDKDEILRGFWIDKKMIDSINKIALSEKPDRIINGYNVFFGQYPKAGNRKYALLVRATIDSIKPSSTKIDTLSAGSFFDMVDPCPDHCGEQ